MQRTALGLEARGHTVWIVSHPESRLTISASPGVRIISKRLGMDFNPVMIAYLVGLIKMHKIQVAVTNIQKEITIGGTAAKLSGIASVRRIGNENDINPRFWWRQRHLVDFTIAPSRSVLEKAEERSGPLDPERYTVIHNGCDPEDYSAEEILRQRRAWGLPDRGFVVGYTGQLAPVKGLDRLVEVFKRLVEVEPNVYLVLTGEGPGRADLEALASDLGISDRVVFAGFSSKPLRAAAAYDVAVLNSSQEGFPNTLVEYMAAGTATVSTDVGGVKEILKHGENGLLTSVGDNAQVFDAITSLLRDEALRRRLGREALRTVKTGFSERVMLDRLESILRSRISGRRG